MFSEARVSHSLTVCLPGPIFLLRVGGVLFLVSCSFYCGPSPGGLCPRGSLSKGGLCPRGFLSREVSVWGVSVRGCVSSMVSVQGVLCSGVSVQGISVWGGICRKSERGAVRILLECFLVFSNMFAENCMEMKEFGPREKAGIPKPPLDIIGKKNQFTHH